MAQPCQKGRCPARADVYDWNTTEYRKGCRRTQCTTAHTLAEQRRRAKKDEKAAAEPPTPVVVAVPEGPGSADREELDLVALVEADLEGLDAEHPLRKSLGGVALALAHELQFLVRVPSRSGAGAAKQLVETLERLMPTKKGSLEEELERLFADDDDDEPATAQ